MTSPASHLQRARLLEVRTLHIASGDGGTTRISTVACPSRQQAVPVEDCLRCDAGAGLTEDPAAHAKYVSCRAPAPPRQVIERATDGVVKTLAERTLVASLMTREVLAVRVDVAVDALRTLFVERGIGGAAVADGQGRPIGIVSKTDLLRDDDSRGDTDELEPRGARRLRDLGVGFHAEGARRTVGDVMNRRAFTLSEAASVSEAAALMAFEGVHRVPVVSSDGKVVGMVTTLDILRWLAQQDGYLLPASSTLQAR